MKEKFDFKIHDALKIYFTSDTHFGHKGIIDFCNRPFKSVEEMDKELIIKWNEKVPEDGLVFHLGDFAWGGHPFWENIRKQLNGDIILIKGNHDEKNLTKTGAETLFKNVTYQLKLLIEDRPVYLNHNPFLCYAGTYRDKNSLVYQLHGHVHVTRKAPKGMDIKRVLANEFPTQYDVGVDFNDYAPLSWKEVDEKIKEQIKENNNLKMWIEE